MSRCKNNGLTIILIFLVGLPSFYQSYHQVFSHHHHFESITLFDGQLLNVPEENCDVANYVLYKVFPVNSDIDQGINHIFLTVFFSERMINCEYEKSLHLIRGPPQSIV